MDFYQVKERSLKKGTIDVYPDFKVCRSKDLMVRGKSFYAIWDEDLQLWSTDEYEVQRIVDKDIFEHRDNLIKRTDENVVVKLMGDFSSRSWKEFREYIQRLSDNYHMLDEKLTFSNTEIKKKDYVSKRLPYPLEKNSIDAYEELISTLYDAEERAKIEWAIGSIIAGDSKDIQKFIVLYGEQGTGKSTILNIIQKLFHGYYTTFEAKALTSSSNQFSTEAFKSNPLVAIQHDGDLSRIEDNTKLNSIISHEDMLINEKHKPSYTTRINSFLFMGTNKPVKITDAKSGIIRRLIDVRPTGEKIPAKRYQALYSQIDFELGGIAWHCLETYRAMGKNYYSTYRPIDMMMQTDIFFNFIEEYFYQFKEQNYTTLSQAYELYKKYCDDSLVDFKLPKHKFREELKNYFSVFSEVGRIEGKQLRSLYTEFMTSKFNAQYNKIEEPPATLVMDYDISLLDDYLKDCKAQYANLNETPNKKWDEVKTKLLDIDTSKLHYVKPKENHIVIDFDLKDEDGNKSSELNIEAASKWPPTYSEYSKGGSGIHLHYIYDGDIDKLRNFYDEYIEIKTFKGGSSLRRKLTKCNNIPIANINSGLPLKGEKVINQNTVFTENGIRKIIEKNLRKEYHPGTKPSIDFIYKILEDAYNSNVVYDVLDMRSKILSFALKSTNQANYCIKLVDKMKFTSEKEELIDDSEYKSEELVFFDCEVFPNLFLVNWKYAGEGKSVVRMINPKPSDIEALLKLKLVGFKCRRYDNHMLYACYLGYNNTDIYKLSQKIVNKGKGRYNGDDGFFREAYNLSYCDIYDFSSVKQSLKKFEIELGLHHQELGLPWDEPVPEELWMKVAEYCDNDVYATEATFNARKEDFVARQILSELSGLTVNSTTQQHAAKIIFGNDPNPQKEFVYTDLSKEFPDYVFDHGKSTYCGEDVSEGGEVYAEPGMYSNVALLDIESMHPTSIEELNMFGKYTKRFSEIKQARLAIKHGELKKASSMLDGILEKYLKEGNNSKALSYALKIVINIVYGLTSASFENKFRDPRNKDNICAKRGSLFMVNLRKEVQKRGFTVAHIKTDSIKIPDATPEIIEFVKEYGKKYGYTFDHEDTYKKMCLVNDAVYIAKSSDGSWVATGTQFAVPFVFKTLFSKEKLVFNDFCEVKQVNSEIYIDMNEDNEEEHNYKFVGKIGQFCPIKKGHGGGILYRKANDKYYSVGGTKGFRWLESEVVKELKKEDSIDISYYQNFVNEAIETISKYGDFEWFVNEDKEGE